MPGSKPINVMPFLFALLPLTSSVFDTRTRTNESPSKYVLRSNGHVHLGGIFNHARGKLPSSRSGGNLAEYDNGTGLPVP
jgi:hypothetical protein